MEGVHGEPMEKYQPAFNSGFKRMLAKGRNNCDRYIPPICVNRVVKAVLSNTKACSADVAPTPAKIAGVPVKEHIDGKALFRQLLY